MRPHTLPVLLSFLATACQPQPPAGRAQPDRSAPAAVKHTPSGSGDGRTVIEIAAPSGEAGGAVVTARYEQRALDPVLEEMRARDKDWKAEQGKQTGKITQAQEVEDEKKRKEKLVLRSSLPEDQRPTSLEQFTIVDHLPPVPQYYTGTCWSFCTTSLMESEVIRKTGKRIKLSEMSTVYWEYLAKAGGYVDTRGDSLFAEGSQAAALLRAYREHGAWPAEAYPGVGWEDGKHDHQRMVREMKAVLKTVSKKGIWDRVTVTSLVQVILDRDMGRPPETFTFEGKNMTGQGFLTDVLTLDPDEYVGVVSTLRFPFHTRGEFEVPDNWWHDDSYHNVPLDEFYDGLRNAIRSGYTLIIALDVSEPGKDGPNDVMFVPEYDIPADRIDQLAREYRFAHKVTTDDHGIHLVGHTEHAGHDWFLVKDSGRSARRGTHEGYYFVRDDYIKLKVLSYTVHRDGVSGLLAKFEPGAI